MTMTDSHGRSLDDIASVGGMTDDENMEKIHMYIYRQVKRIRDSAITVEWKMGKLRKIRNQLNEMLDIVLKEASDEYWEQTKS